MTTTTSIHAAILAALSGAGVYAVYGPADELPIAPDGLIGQAAVLWPSARMNQYGRMTGTRSGGVDELRVACIGPTANDALAVADKVNAALDGLTLSPKGGPLMQIDGAKTPDIEPNADPVRYVLGVLYQTITKG